MAVGAASFRSTDSRRAENQRRSAAGRDTGGGRQSRGGDGMQPWSKCPERGRRHQGAGRSRTRSESKEVKLAPRGTFPLRSGDQTFSRETDPIPHIFRPLQRAIPAGLIFGRPLSQQFPLSRTGRALFPHAVRHDYGSNLCGPTAALETSSKFGIL